MHFIQDHQKIQLHINEIINETDLSNLRNGISKNEIISNLKNRDFLNNIELKLNHLLKKEIPNFGNHSYESVIQNHKPTIIAININSSKIVNKTGIFDGIENDLLVIEENISPKNIVARIIFEKKT